MPARVVAPLEQKIDFQFVHARPVTTAAVDPRVYDFRGRKREFARSLASRLNTVA